MPPFRVPLNTAEWTSRRSTLPWLAVMGARWYAIRSTRIAGMPGERLAITCRSGSMSWRRRGLRDGVCVQLHLSSYMRPNGPWQQLRCY